MSGERDSYRQILKATSVFGGVQVFSIIINLIKSKVIAVFLGTEGMGIYSLLQNPVNLVSQISGLGLNSSGIRDVAQHADDKIEFSKTVKTVQSWSRVTGLVGTIILFLMAPIISQWTFGNSAYSLDFRFLSLSVFLLAIGLSPVKISIGMLSLNAVETAMTRLRAPGPAVATQTAGFPDDLK